MILQQNIITHTHTHTLTSHIMCTFPNFVRYLPILTMKIRMHATNSMYIYIYNTIIPYLIGIVFRKKDDFYVACFANKRLRLLCFAAKHTRLSTIRYISFSITIHNLWWTKQKFKNKINKRTKIILKINHSLFNLNFVSRNPFQILLFVWHNTLVNVSIWLNNECGERVKWYI